MLEDGGGRSEWIAGPKDGRAVGPPILCVGEITKEERTSITYTHLCLNR